MCLQDDSTAWSPWMWKDHTFKSSVRKPGPVSQGFILKNSKIFHVFVLISVAIFNYFFLKQVTGEVSYNGYGLDKFVPQKTSAYISQTDLHIAEMTVRETLDFSARCQGVGSREG